MAAIAPGELPRAPGVAAYRAASGPPASTVCAICQQRLIQRQALQDEQSEFENEVTRHRLFNEDLALRLNHERLQLTSSLQAARLGLDKRSVLGHVLHGIRWTAVALFKMVKYVIDM